MNPIPYISTKQRDLRRDTRAQRNHQSGPLTDCFYQPSPNPGGSSSPISGDAFRISKLHMFRKLSSDFFGAEAGRDYVAELRVQDNGDHTSTVIWSAAFVAKDGDEGTVAAVRKFLKAGLDNLSAMHSGPQF